MYVGISVSTKLFIKLLWHRTISLGLDFLQKTCYTTKTVKYFKGYFNETFDEKSAGRIK